MDEVAYRWVDHTAEVELQLEGATEGAVFEQALRAVSELIGDGSSAERLTFDVVLTAPDRATLLAGWLDELVYRAETEALVPEAVEDLALGADRLTARVRARHGSPRHLVKGVTYHRLVFEPVAAGFRATVILDV